MAQDNILAVIDIGSAETKVLIVDLEPQLQVIGAFCAKTEGMRKGEIVNLGALKESVHSAIRQAEKMAGAARRVRGAFASRIFRKARTVERRPLFYRNDRDAAFRTVRRRRSRR